MTPPPPPGYRAPGDEFVACLRLAAAFAAFCRRAACFSVRPMDGPTRSDGPT